MNYVCPCGNRGPRRPRLLGEIHPHVPCPPPNHQQRPAQLPTQERGALVCARSAHPDPLKSKALSWHEAWELGPHLTGRTWDLPKVTQVVGDGAGTQATIHPALGRCFAHDTALPRDPPRRTRFTPGASRVPWGWAAGAGRVAAPSSRVSPQGMSPSPCPLPSERRQSLGAQLPYIFK